MRSHMMNHQFVPPKPDPQQQQQQQQQQHLPSKNSQLSEEADSASSSSSDEENEEKLLGYELRENPKKSTRLVDREFSFTTTGSDVVLIQDRESETESSKNPIRRRSKRVRRSGISNYHHIQFQNRNLNNPPEMKKPKWGKTESEPEPVSSISDTTPDEDVAYCLMMLSRDAWMREKDDDELEEAEEKTEDSVTELNTNKSIKIRSRNRGKYKCETCFKLFRSYQALGGHRASHKKIKGTNDGLFQTHERLEIEKRNAGVDEEKIHECPVCYRVFSSGQALGGHKRSHGIGSAFGSTSAPVKPKLKSGEPLIDLNLPAPVDDEDDYGDEFSQIENSAVSDAELFNPIKQ